MKIEFRTGAQVGHRTKRLIGNSERLKRLLSLPDGSRHFWIRAYGSGFHVSLCGNPSERIIYIERKVETDSSASFYDYDFTDLAAAKSDFILLCEEEKIPGRGSRSGMQVFPGGPGTTVRRNPFQRLYDYFYQRISP
jgi:hypothetical protein